MPADASAPPVAEKKGIYQLAEPSRSAELYGDALNQHPRVAAAPEQKRHVSNLWRMRPYLYPYVPRYLTMVVTALLSTGAAIVIPLVTRAVIDGPIASKSARGVWTLGVAALALGVLEALLWFIRRWVVSRATLGTETGIRLDLYAKLQRLPMGFHNKWASGQLLSRIMNDLSTVRRFFGFGLLMMIMSVLQIVTVVILLLQMYWPLGLIVLAAVVPTVWLCMANEREYTRLSRRVQDETGDVASTVEEGVQGLRVIKAFGRSDHMFAKFDDRSTKLFDTSMDRVRLTSKFWTFLEVIPTVTLVIVLGVGAVAAAQHRLTMGTLVAFITLLLSLIWPVAGLGFLLSMTQDAMTASDRICEIFDAEETITDGPRTLTDVTGRLTFAGVGFRFADADHDLVHDVNLGVAPGETVALVGGTGPGKTTLTALVPRLVDVTAGSIQIDGVDIRELKLANLRSIVATAFEDPTLFSMSARENLTLGRPDATEDDIAEAVEVAQAHFVYDLPWGLDTRLGEQGMSLSGGQRQRLALARAVLTRPRVLVLDDTLSALDIHTEALVEEALKRVLVGVTGIVVAHRASTVLLADRVALLQDGTITHVGTHHDLLETVPEYRDLLSAEFDAEEELDYLEGHQEPDPERGRDLR